MHQQFQVRNGVNYPVTLLLSNITLKYEELMTILDGNKSVDQLLTTSQTSKFHFVIPGMHFHE